MEKIYTRWPIAGVISARYAKKASSYCSRLLLLVLLLSVTNSSHAQITKKTFVFKINASGITTTQAANLGTQIDYTNKTTYLTSGDDKRICSFNDPTNAFWGRMSLHYRKENGMISIDFVPLYGDTSKRNVYNLFHTKTRVRDGDNVIKLEIDSNVMWITCNPGTVATDVVESNTTGEGILWNNKLSVFNTTNLVMYSTTTLLKNDSSTSSRRLTGSYFDDPVYDEYGYDEEDLTQPAALGNGLNFDGSNDYVSVPSSSAFSFGTGNFSLEAWVKYTANASVRVIAGRFNGTPNDYWLGVNGDKAQFSINGSGIMGSKIINDGTWHHISGVRNNGMLSLYVDGKPDATSVANTNVADPGGSFNIGIFGGGYFFPGTVDEVRVWNIARTQANIQADKNFQLTGNETGLIAYYNFDQGTTCGTNTGITSLPDITGHANTGTLTNMALTGTTSNWVPGVIPSSYDTICVGNATQLDNYIETGVWSSTNTAVATVSSKGQVIGISPGTATINYTVANANGCPSVSSTIVTVNAIPTTTVIAGNGLNFDGTNDYVSVPVNTSIPIGNSAYSIEAWIKPTIHTSEGIVGWGNWGTTNQTNSFRLGDNNTVRNGWYNTELTVTSGNLADGAWHHVAATFDGTTRKIYVDGVLKGQDNPTGHNVPYSNNLKIGSIGTEALGNVQNFKGNMDELRIWNVARSQAEILATMNTELAGNERGLAAQYNFNTGTATGTNTVTTLADKSNNNNTGTLTNFALTGTTSNWVNGSVVSMRSALSNGLSFDGVNDYVSVPTSTNIPAGNSNYTLEAWIKPNVHATNGIVGWGTWWGNNQTNALRLGDNNAVHNYWWGNDLVVTSGNLADGAWHHIAATYDGTTRKIYVDGVVKGQDNPTGHNVDNTGNICIGRTYENEYFNGKIDEVRIWNIARSQADIQAAMYTELSGTEAGLASYYGFNNGTAEGTNAGKTILSDKTSSINSGVLNNFALTGTTSNWVPGSIAGSGTSICAGRTVQLNNASTGGTWSSSDASIATVSSTGLVTGVLAGTAIITYTNANTSGCAASSVTTIEVTETTKPVVTATSTNICSGANSVLSTAQLAGYTYKWATTPNGTSIGSQSTLTVSPSFATTYYVSVTNSSGCTATSDGITIDVTASTMAAMANSAGAKQIAVGPTGRIYTILSDDRIYLWTGSWTRVSNTIYASSLAIQSNGNLWFVAKTSTPNEVYYIACDANGMPTGNSTEFYQSAALKVACGANGTVAIIGTDHNIWKWNGNVGASGNSSSFTYYAYTYAGDVAVDNTGRIWYVDGTYHGVSYLSSSSQWTTLTGYAANQISCGTDGSVFVTGWGDNAIYKWNGTTGFNVVSALGTANTDLAVYNASTVVKLDAGTIYKPQCLGAQKGTNDPDNGPAVESIKQEQVRVYPNPNNGTFTAAFTLRQASPVTLRLVDVQGRVLYEAMKDAAAGTHAYELSPQNLVTGIYFLKISTYEFSKTETVSIQK